MMTTKYKYKGFEVSRRIFSKKWTLIVDDKKVYFDTLELFMKAIDIQEATLKLLDKFNSFMYTTQ